MKGEAGWMRRHPRKGREGGGGGGEKDDPTWGGRARRSELQLHPLLHEVAARPTRGKKGGGGERKGKAGNKNTFRQARHPRGRRKFLAFCRRPSTTSEWGGEKKKPSRRPFEKASSSPTWTLRALREHPDRGKRKEGKKRRHPTYDNKFAALNTAVWFFCSFV